MDSQQIEIPMDAARVCEAIARIGYSPASALMDIIDNSITAGATEIVVEIQKDEDKTYATKNNVVAYSVIDNGKGMENSEIENAFRLGSNADYPEKSLSKYGIGLKSAGFSLGSRIQLISKSQNHWTHINYVDKHEIRKAGKYIVTRVPLSVEYSNECEVSINASASGTIVNISGCQETNHDSAKSTVDRLISQLGVFYYEFLRRKKILFQ